MGDSNLLLKVQYKFKNDNRYITITITEQQYLNLLELPVMESCEIIGSTKQTVAESVKREFNERITLACGSDTGHTKYLLQ